MRIDIVKLSLLCLFWFSLVGLPNNYASFWQFFISVFASYSLAQLLQLSLPTDQLNWQSFKYSCWLITEIFRSSIGVIKIILSPKIKVNSGFAWLDHQQKSPLGVLIYANSITLTPGTVTIKTDDKKLFIHFLEKSSLAELQSGEMDGKIAKIINVTNL